MPTRHLKIFFSREFQKFIIIGAASTIINYGVFYLLIEINLSDYLVAAILGYMAGLLFGYVFNRIWTFSSKNHKKLAEFSKYLGVYIASLILSMLFLAFLVEYLGISPLISNIFAIGLSTVTNFIGCKIIVFRKREHGYPRKPTE